MSLYRSETGSVPRGLPIRCPVEGSRAKLRALALIAALMVQPGQALAVGSDDDTPPDVTPTTTVCEGTQIWDETTQTCKDARQDNHLTDEDRYGAVRELAHAGAYARAMSILETFQMTQDDRRLTYLGFVSRMQGDLEAAMEWYQAALVQNPDNLLARSYLGQAYAVGGDRDLARAQLREIRTRGGRESWPERALMLALRAGPSPAY